MDMRDTKTTGDLTEAVVLATFLRRGECVLRPFGENARYDLVLDRDGVFVRVQCKTGRLRNGAVEFNAYSVHRNKTTRRYNGQADFFGIYCPQNDKVYLVPVGEVGERGVLRFQPTSFGPKNRLKSAQEYELSEQASSHRLQGRQGLHTPTAPHGGCGGAGWGYPGRGDEPDSFGSTLRAQGASAAL